MILPSTKATAMSLSDLGNNPAFNPPARLTISRISTRSELLVATMMTFWIVSRLSAVAG